MDNHDNSSQSSFKVLVTGADGMLGTNIVRELLDRGHKVYCFIETGHDGSVLKGWPVKIFEGDICSESDLIPLFSECDYVIHTAGITAMWPARNSLSWKVNYDAVKLLVTLSRKYGIKRFVHIGTATSFGHGSRSEPGNEESPYSNFVFRLDYQDTKYRAQEYLLKEFRENSFPVIILNPTFMLGKYDTGNGSNKMVLYIYKGKIPGYSPGGKNYVNVKDVAYAAVNALTMGKVGECYITGNKNMSYREAFQFIAETLEVKPPGFRLPASLSISFGAIQSVLAAITGRSPDISYRMARIGCVECYYSSEKAIRELGMPQTPLAEAVQDSMEWLRDSGKL